MAVTEPIPLRIYIAENKFCFLKKIQNFPKAVLLHPGRESHMTRTESLIRRIGLCLAERGWLKNAIVAQHIPMMQVLGNASTKCRSKWIGREAS